MGISDSGRIFGLLPEHSVHVGTLSKKTSRKLKVEVNIKVRLTWA